MIFSSTVFLFAFLPAFIAVYSVSGRARNLAILSFSLLFYVFGEGYFGLILLFSIVANYSLGLRLRRGRRHRKYWLWVAISLNLLLLGVFKYADFVHTDLLGLPEQDAIGAIHLPIGISFFTFQSISYLVDSYRDPERVESSAIRFATYISMFPQLIAGPIVRFAPIARSLAARRVSAKMVYFGAVFFAVGLAEKVLIADTVAVIADDVFGRRPEDLNAAAVWLGGLAYSLQIFFDFSGYSAMAIGLGLVMGFEFPRNFNFPYIAQSVRGFWRRWHLSLSQWFRDYLYIPLGGNRSGQLRTVRNLALVFLLTGLWHGAAWTFVVWGVWHGLFVLIERAGFQHVLDRTWPGVRIAYTLLVVYIGWIFFRAEDVPHALAFLQQHFAFQSDGAPIVSYLNHEKTLTLLVGIAVSTPGLMALSRRFMATCEYGAWHKPHPIWKYATGLCIAGALFLLASIKILSGAHSPFIYFRF